MTEKEPDLILKIQELQFKVWELESMAAGLMETLNAAFCAQKIQDAVDKQIQIDNQAIRNTEERYLFTPTRQLLEQVRVETAKKIFEELEDMVLFLDTSKTLVFQKGNYDTIKAKFLQEKKTE